MASVPRRARTRDALLVAGRKLFAEHAFDAVAVDDIVDEAVVAKGTFYNHFEDKDALLAAVVAAVRMQIETVVERVNAGVDDPAERLVRAICVYVDCVIEDPSAGAILLRNDPHRAGSEPLNDGLRSDLTDGVRLERFSMPTIDGGLHFVMGVAQSLLFSTVRHGDALPPLDQTRQLCALLLRAFGIGAAEAETIAGAAATGIIGKGAAQA